MHRTYISCILIIALTFMVAGCERSVESEGQQNAEVILVDVGDVPPGSQVGETVNIPNHTGDTLEVDSISTSCGCIEKHLTNTTIEKNRKVDLVMTFNVPEVRGPFDHNVDITFTNGDLLRVTLKGTVGAWFRVNQSIVDFGEVKSGTSVAQELVVTVHESLRLSTPEIQVDFPHATVKDEKRSGNEFKYVVEFEPTPEKRLARHDGEILIDWVGTGRTIRIPCVAVVRSPLFAEPQAVFFGIVPIGEIRRARIKLKCDEASELTPKTIVSESIRDIVKTKWHDERSQLEIVLDTNDSNKGAASGTVEVSACDATVLIDVDCFLN